MSNVNREFLVENTLRQNTNLEPTTLKAVSDNYAKFHKCRQNISSTEISFVS